MDLNDHRIAPVKPITLRDQVYDQIRQAILERRLKPGDHMREQELTKMLSVSRTPLREALGLLERDGLVVNFPNRGWFVTKFTAEEINDIFVLRAGLENLAADLIIERLTDTEMAELQAIINRQAQALADEQDLAALGVLDRAFHRRIVELSGNSRLLRMWQHISVQCAMAFNYQTITIPDYDHTLAITDHTAILDALRSRDPEKVHSVNNEINGRVAAQCIEGNRALEEALTTAN